MSRTLFAPALALAALVSAQTAQAQASCVKAEDAADAVVYLLPTAYDRAQSTCASVLGNDSFLNSDAGIAFRDNFEAQQDARWAGTFRFFRVFTQKQSNSDDPMANFVNTLSPEELRPLFNVIVGELVNQEITPETCPKIDRGLALVSPLPVDNVGGLVAFILAEVDVKDPPICKGIEVSPRAGSGK